MDLHLTDAQATAEERAAVDSELGAPESSWQGGQRQTADTRAAFNGATHGRRHRASARAPCVQNRIGWISPGALNYVALRLDVAPAEVHGVASFYGMFSLQPRPPVVAHVCDDIACVTRGADKLCAELERRLGPAGSPCAERTCHLAAQPMSGSVRARSRGTGQLGWRGIACNECLAPASADAVQSLVSDAVRDACPPSRTCLPSKASVPQAAAAPSGPWPLRLLHRISRRVRRLTLEDYQTARRL